MKNSYLNSVLTFRVYLRMIQKKKQKQKCIVNKPKKRRKIRRKYVKRFTTYTY